MNLNTILKVFGEAAKFILIIIISAIILSFPTMLVWNWVMVTIFELPMVTFWQMWGIMFLCNMLFKSRKSDSK